MFAMRTFGLLFIAHVVIIALQNELCMAGIWSSSKTDSTSSNIQAPLSKYDYKQTIKKPYYFNGEIPFWETGGDVIKSDEFIRLTPSVPGTRGWIWSKQPNTHKSWEIEVVFKITGSQMHGGRGLALWYTKEPMMNGPIFGSKDKWEGLAVWLDSANPKMRTPTTMAIFNDGKIAFAEQKDPSYYVMGACTVNYRNTGSVAARLHVRYKGDTLTVKLDPTGDGKTYQTCIQKSRLNLPAGYYFGLSASSSSPADDHDIISFETWQLDPPPKNTRPTRPLEEEMIRKGEEFKALDEEQKRKIEETEFQVRRMREAKAKSDTTQEAAATMATVFDTQKRILDTLQVLRMQIEALGAPTPEMLMQSHIDRNSPAVQGGLGFNKEAFDAAFVRFAEQVKRETQGIVSQVTSTFERHGKDQNSKADDMREFMNRVERTMTRLENRMALHQKQLSEMTKDSARTRGTISTFLKYISYALASQVVIALVFYLYWKMRVVPNKKKFL